MGVVRLPVLEVRRRLPSAAAAAAVVAVVAVVAVADVPVAVVFPPLNGGGGNIRL